MTPDGGLGESENTPCAGEAALVQNRQEGAVMIPIDHTKMYIKPTIYRNFE